MPLPIRDGNQSLTTLSTILVSNSHVPAHTVVSLGAQAITDIATAVSGVELGPNTLNALENITVTLGQVTITGGLTDAQLRASAVTVGGGIYIADAQSVIGSSIPPEVIQIGGKSLADSKLYPIAVDSNGVQSIIGAVTASISGTPSVTFGTAVITGSTSILNFPATQTVTFTQASVTFGTSVVTGSVSVLNIPATQTVTFSQAPVTFGTAVVTGSTSILNFPATQTVTFTQASVTFSQPTITGSVSVLNFPASQSVTFTTATVTFGTAVITGSTSVLNFPATQTVTFSEAPVTFGLISGTVTANPTGTQTIAGTVTANLANVVTTDSFWGTQAIKVTGGNGYGIDIAGVDSAGNRAIFDEGGGIPVYPRDNVAGGASFPISGTVTIGSALPTGTNRIGVVTIGGGTVTLGASTSQIGSVTASISNSLTISSLPAISGTVTANAFGVDSSDLANRSIPILYYDVQVESATYNYVVPVQISNTGGAIGSQNPLPISGTVTANSSNGSLTTRFGSVVTANTAFETSAVTNANRKYLLIQNITTASNMITIGIGFTPTTTQGIQLFAGAGLTFEGNYIPTGSVNLLSSVTASCYTILEA